MCIADDNPENQNNPINHSSDNGHHLVIEPSFQTELFGTQRNFGLLSTVDTWLFT